MADLIPIIQTALFERFGERLEFDGELAGLDEIARISAHRVHRRYRARWYRAAVAAIVVRLRPLGPFEE